MLGERELTTRRTLRLLTVFLSVSITSSNAFQIVQVPDKLQVNQTVLFNVTGISERIRFSEWYRGNDTSAANQMIRYNNNDNSKNVGQRSILTADIFADGSLEIKNVTKDLEGDYTVLIQGSTKPYQKTVLLEVDVFLSVSIASSNAFQIVQVPDKLLVNQTVLFLVIGISERIRFSEWYRGNDTSAANQIIRYNNNDNSKNVGQRPIETADIFDDGSLEIKNVTKDLEGNYTVLIQGSTKPYQKTVLLEVQESYSDNRHSGLSGGAIAAIVIGAVAVAFGIGGGIYAIKSKTSKHEGPL